MNVVEKANDILSELEKMLMICAWISTIFVTFMIVTDILLRFFLNRPLPASWEISEIMMPYIVMFGFSQALAKGAHVQVSLFTRKLPAKANFGCEIVAYVICLVMCGLLTYWSWMRFWQSFIIKEEILAAISLPWWVGKLGMPIAFAVFGFRYMMMVILKLMHLNT